MSVQHDKISQYITPTIKVRVWHIWCSSFTWGNRCVMFWRVPDSRGTKWFGFHIFISEAAVVDHIMKIVGLSLQLSGENVVFSCLAAESLWPLTGRYTDSIMDLVTVCPQQL